MPGWRQTSLVPPMIASVFVQSPKLNMSDTVALIANKLQAIVPFDTCVIFIVDDRLGKAVAIHVGGDHMDLFNRRRINIGDGISGWVIANARSMCNSSPELA